MTSRRSVLLLVCFLSISANLFSNNSLSIIKGKLVESGTKLPIDFGAVFLTDKSSKKDLANAIPEKDGSFILSGVKEGEYNLIIKVMGYNDYIRENVKINSDLDLGVIELKSTDYGLEEVTVVGAKRQIVYKLDKKVIEAGKNLQATGGTAIDILENTPSIQINAEGEISFRGSSGFTVYIDGKPGVLSGSDALEQIPSGLIENIEIITTPSARHDTGGDVGIINVIMKKHTQEGVSGMVNLTGSTATTRGGDFLLTKQNNNIRWHLGGDWYDRYRKSDFDQEKTTIVGDTSTLSHSNGPRRSTNYNYSLKTGALYSLPKTSFNVEVQGGYTKKARRGELDYYEERHSDGRAFENGNYISYDDYFNYKKFIRVGGGFIHKFNKQGHQLAGDGFYQNDWHSLEYFQSDLFDQDGKRQQGHRAYEDESHVTGQATLDYTNPYSETGHLDAGYKFYSYLEDGDYSMEYWSPETQSFYWRDDIYNLFYFQQGIHSIYAILGDYIKKFEYQLGLRGEHTHRVLGSSYDWANRTFNRFELFPSVHLGYHFPNEDIVTASYSRRTTRPDLFYMEPYLTFRDYYSAEVGNPDIRPEYIHSFELNYKKNIKEHSISATAFYRDRKDKIERLRVPYVAGVTLDSMANVGHDYSIGMELFAQVQAARWWTMNFNGSYYRYKVKNEYKLVGGTDGESNNYGISLGNVFETFKNFRIQLDGYMVGPSVTTQGKTDSFGYVNLALRKQFLNKKLSATLSFRDLFNTARYRSDITTANLQSITYIKPLYPLISLTLNYTFNNYKVKSSEAKVDHDLFEGTNH
jgi:outer membrane receptor protein involved in Fe transport